MQEQQRKDIGWGSDRISYTLDQLKYLSEVKKLNDGRVSTVFEIVLDEGRFPWAKTPRQCAMLVGLIEDCDKKLGSLCAGLNIDASDLDSSRSKN